LKKNVRKLSLSRETIISLQGKVVGATGGPTGYDQIQATDCACAMTTAEYTYCVGFVSYCVC